MKRLWIALIVVALLVVACVVGVRCLPPEIKAVLDEAVDDFTDTLRAVFGESEEGGEQPPADGDPAPDNPTPDGPTPDNPSADDPPTSGGGASDFDENDTLVGVDAALYEVLAAAVQARKTEVNVESFGYGAAQLKEEISRFFFTNPALFYVDHSYRYYTVQGSGTVKTVELSYLYSVQESAPMSAFYESEVQRIVGGIPAGASDFDKVLYLHDYLVKNYAYDYEGLSGTPIRDAYNFFKTGRGVCQAYMLAMIALCEAAGVPALPVISDEMEHAWNLVKLDGKWYHVDVTWDDAGGEQAPVYPSFVSYQYFLLSAEALYQGGRTAQWYATERADSTLYDAARWRAASTGLVKSEQYYYCVLFDSTAKVAKLYRGDAVQLSEVVALENGRWLSGPDTFYHAAWAGLALWKGELLVSSATAFFRYDTQSGTLTKVADLTSALGDKQIFGICGVSDAGTVRYVAAEDYHGTYSIKTWVIPAA